MEKSLEAPEVEEVSEEDIELAGMGFNLDKIDAYKKRFTLTSVIHQKYPKNDFLEWYLKACTKEELNLLKEHLDKFRKNQVEKIEKAEVLDVIEQPSDTSIQGYIEKNAKLFKDNTELVQLNNELFQKIAQLQEERDILKNLTKTFIDIFKDNKIKTDKLTIDNIELIKELSK